MAAAGIALEEKRVSEGQSNHLRLWGGRHDGCRLQAGGDGGAGDELG